MRISFALAAAALILAYAPAHAQNSTPTYKVEFSIHDGNGPAAKVRRFTLVTVHNTKAILTVGSRVPAATGTSGNAGNVQYTYLDIGVNIECIVGDARQGGGLGMHAKIDMSSIVQHEPKSESIGGPNPTVGQTKMEMDTAVELSKPIVVATVDDPETMRQTRVEAIVTRLN